MQDGPPPAREDVLALRDLIEGTRIARAVYVVTRLRVPDLLASGPMSTSALAGQVGADERALYRVLRALANRGLFEERDDGFALLPRGGLLRAGAPGSLREWALWHGSEWVFRAWGEFEHSVREGQPAFDQAFGAPFFEYLASNAEMADTFGGAMVSIGRQIDEALLEAYDFSRFATVADVGGGSGALLALLLRRHPRMRAVLFDLPEVIPRARELLGVEELVDRVEFVAGDFFEEVPSGANAYILKAILHDWEDSQAATILANCRRAMAPDDTLVVAGMVVPGSGTPSTIKEFDLQMLAIQTGRERTEVELRELLASTGFELTDVLPTPSPLSLTIARPR